MQPILERADSAQLPCYLETHRESNVRLYQRHGFEICRQAAVPGHPIPVWAMLQAALSRHNRPIRRRFRQAIPSAASINPLARACQPQPRCIALNGAGNWPMQNDAAP